MRILFTFQKWDISTWRRLRFAIGINYRKLGISSIIGEYYWTVIASTEHEKILGDVFATIALYRICAHVCVRGLQATAAPVLISGAHTRKTTHEHKWSFCTHIPSYFDLILLTSVRVWVGAHECQRVYVLECDVEFVNEGCVRDWRGELLQLQKRPPLLKFSCRRTDATIDALRLNRTFWS